MIFLLDLNFSVATRSFQIQLYLCELELAKSSQGTIVLNLENRSFENASLNYLSNIFPLLYLLNYLFKIHRLTHETLKLSSYRNQLIDLQSKSIDWFLYDGNFGV